VTAAFDPSTFVDAEEPGAEPGEQERFDPDAPELPEGWTPHHGYTGRPVGRNVSIVIRYRNGIEVGPIPAGSRRWGRWYWGESDFDIVGWRLASGADL
jgi:hypothetical protein